MIAVFIGVISRRILKGILAGYVFLVVAITILSRPRGVVRYELRPFWSYGIPYLRYEIILNILMFIPIGIAGMKSIGWKCVVYSMIFSLAIELSQFLTGRGLFEFDDIIHNTLGTVMGCAIWCGLYTICAIWRKRDDTNDKSRNRKD